MPENDFLLVPGGLQKIDCSRNDCAIASLFDKGVIARVDSHTGTEKHLTSIGT
jgi:hypothetical protein